MDVEEQLRKRELDALMFQTGDRAGAGTFRGGTAGARHLITASSLRRDRANRLGRTPSAAAKPSHLAGNE
eukprot:scaffold445616_cov48-Prasinocladus_malaysianus.AAC.1